MKNNYKLKLNVFKKTVSVFLIAVMLLATVFSTCAYAADAATISAYVKTLNTYRTEIYRLINECSKKGIPTDYEYIVYSILNRWRTDELVKPSDSIEAAYFEKFYYNRNPENYFENYLKPSLDAMYQEAKANLEGYLNGTKTPKDVPKYVTSTMEIDGFTVKADTVNTAGVKERRPVYFVGYGHFEQAKDTIPQYQKFGVNTVQNEIGPDSLLRDYFPWSYTTDVTKGKVDFSEDTYLSAPCSIKFTKDISHSTGTEIKLSQNINIENNTEYTLRFKAKAVNVSGAKYYVNGLGFDIDSGTFDWQEYTYTFTSSASQLAALLAFSVTDVCDELYIDDVSLIKTGTTENVVPDGNFDEYLPSADRKYFVYTKGTEYVHDLLKKGQDYNVAICLLISPHYFPKNTFANEYPDLYTESGQPIISHPKYIEMMEAYLKELLTQIKDYKSLQSICLTNEPGFYAQNYDDYYKPQWYEWLKEKYFDDISALNSYYGTSYTTWEEVGMDVNNGPTGQINDNIEFNRYIFVQWHTWLANTVKKHIPDMPVHTKAQGYLGSYWVYASYLKKGTAYEGFDAFSDIAGCDYSIEWVGVNNGTHRHAAESMWYDYLAGIGEKPVTNTEDHIYVDGEENFNPYQALHMGTNMWQGAIHHRIFSDVWVWRKSYNHEGNIYYGSILFRPDCIKAIGEANLDLNRLSYEVDALVNAPEDIAVLYSDSTRLFNIRSYMDVSYDSYEAMLFNGKKVRVVSEDRIEKINKCKVLVIPAVFNAPKNVVDEIYSFAQNGGKIIILDSASLKKDEFNKEHTGDTLERINYIHNNAKVMTSYSSSKLMSEFQTYLSDNDLQNVWLVDAETGERLPHTEWMSTEYNGNLIINVCNYDYYTPLNAKLVVNGKVVKASTELRSGESYGESFTLNPYSPALISIPSEKPSEIDNITVTKDGANANITWTVNDESISGYNIYKLNGSNLDFIKSSNTNSAVLENIGAGTHSFVIKAKGSTGAESDGVSFSISDSKLFTVSGSAVKKGTEVLYNVTVQGDSTASSGIIAILLKDESNTIIGAATVSGLIQANTAETFKGAVGNFAGNAKTAEIVMLDTTLNGMEISNRVIIDLN